MYDEEHISKQNARKRLENRKNRYQERVSATSVRREQEQPAPKKSPSVFKRFALPLVALVLIGAAFFVGIQLNSGAGQQPASSASASLATTAASTSAQTAASSQSASSVTPSSQQESDDAIDRSALQEILGDDTIVDALIARAKDSADAYWIATHPEAYASGGWEVQHKILKLAAEEPAAVSYVRNWPNIYPMYTQDTASIHAIKTEPTGDANVPMLYQWDPRWAYTVYSSTTFGLTGCCPTAFAMVYQGVTGQTDMTPYDMGMLAQEHGYMTEEQGTDANFIINEAPGLGMICTQVIGTPTALIDELNAGKVIIANVGPGDFTTDGHFIVITGTKNGKLIVNDPYSEDRSQKLWDPDEIINQTKLFLSYEKAPEE